MENSMKQITIRQCILGYDFTNENWSITEIKKQLKKLLGEEPAIKANYVKDVMVNEVSGDAKEVSRLDSISVIFTDLDDKIATLEFKLD